jgi:hypothetical protein
MQQCGDSPADAAGGAGHDGNLAVDFVHSAMLVTMYLLVGSNVKWPIR